jgi:hypothetical protein
MNPVAVAAVLTSLWAVIPEERREKYVNMLLDAMEDLSSDAMEALRRRGKEESAEEGTEESK